MKIQRATKLDQERIKKRELLEALRSISALPGRGAGRARRIASSAVDFIEALEAQNLAIPAS